MQKLFVLKESHKPDDGAGNFEEVNQFMKDTGFVVSVTANFVSGDGNRGRWLVVADDGKGDHDGLLP